MIDEARRVIAQTPVRWDEVRERRVLGAIERRLQQRPVVRRARSRRRLVFASASVAAAALLVAMGWQWRRGSTPELGEPQLAFAELDSSSILPSRDRAATMAFADGSIAHLFQDARLDVDVQTQDLVRLEQPEGKVRYEVTPDPGRRFVVDAQGVHVRVIGTVFTVDVEPDAVMVSVERGRVAVESQDRVAELGVGDELRVERRPRHARADDEAVTEPEEVVVVPEDARPGPSEAGRGENRSALEPPVVSVETLLDRADRARVQGRLEEAASALSELVRRHPKDPRAYSAYFSLGKVERIRGHHAAAASAFAACYKRAPAGSLSEDARAEAAVSWLDAGQRPRAIEAARAYLARHPEGAHAARMQRILQRAQ